MFIYVIQNSFNGKIYIGLHSGDDLRAYLKSKILLAQKGKPSRLYDAMRKHGTDKFSIVPIVSFAAGQITRDQLSKLEQYYIRCFQSRNRDVGYNLTHGGDGTAGYRHSEEQRQLRSEYMKGNTRGHFAVGRPANSGTFKVGHQGIPNSGCFQPGHKKGIGRKASPETRVRMSTARKGKRVSPSTEFKPGLVPWNKKAK